MREIKFRCWFKNKVNWCSQMFYSEEESAGLGDWFSECEIESRKNNNVTFMQYTGIKDKNGREIYEGDIVKYKDYSRGAFFSFSGKDIQPRAIRAIKVENLFEGIYLRGFASMSKASEKLEVIGNIYENPELLE